MSSCALAGVTDRDTDTSESDEYCPAANRNATTVGPHLASTGPTGLFSLMATNSSFDISTGVDLQEVDNAVNQAVKELAQRYDFKGSNCSITFNREQASIALHADDDFRMDALLEIVRGRLLKRGVPVRNLREGTRDAASLGSVRMDLGLAQGIPTETAKKIQRAIKDGGFKKVQASIQGEELRVTSPSRDELQAVIAMLRAADFDVELQFGNFRG